MIEADDPINSIVLKNGKAQPIKLSTSTAVPTFKDAWLSGFIDAEGCFSATARNRRIQLRFSLKQKAEEQLFKDLEALTGSKSGNHDKKKPDIGSIELVSKKCASILDYYTD